jgi:MscS family membrane protein
MKLNKKLLSPAHSLSMVKQAMGKPLLASLWLLLMYVSAVILNNYLHRPELMLIVDNASRVSIIILLLWSGHRFINLFEQTMHEHPHTWQLAMDKTSALAISRLLRFLLYLSGTLIILPTIGIPISGILALGGVGGIAVGFAAKEMLSNFLGGMMLYLERPFSVGDSVELPEKNVVGKVAHIGWRTTKIILHDCRVVYIPNSSFTSTTVINESRRSHFRIYETIELKYSDLSLLPQILEELKQVLKNHPAVEQNDIIHVGLTHLDNNAMHCLLWCFIKTRYKIEYFAVLEEILSKIYHVLLKNHTTLAHPVTLVQVLNNTETLYGN